MICEKHSEAFAEVVECNDCDMLTGYVLVSTEGAVFLMNEKPNLWSTEQGASDFAKKYAISKEWKPRKVFIHFDK
jgi:hypothetical protein